MATTTQFIVAQSSPSVLSGTATIDASNTVSLAVPCGGRSVVRIGIPTIDTGTVTFGVVPYPGATSRVLKNISLTAITVASGTGNLVVNIPELSGAYSFTIICSATQNAARSFDIQCVGENPSL